MRAPDDHDTNEEIIYMLQKENDDLRAQLEEAQEKLAWKPISVPPNEYETVLTIHEKDLFPVCAFRLHHGGRDIWLRQIEGPEDEEHEVKNEELTRPPTHWMPNPPLQAIRSASQG